jgi:sugar phosphate isomerase/epimerase
VELRIEVRFGCCVTPDLIEAAAAAGYDYVELPVAAVLPERPEAEFRSVRERLLSAALKPEAWRLLLPPGLKVAGPNVDWPRAARYAYTALRRIADVGGAIVAFGSAEGRRAPEGFSVDEALDQITEFLRVCGATARSRGLVVGIEPLSQSQCNVINSVPEAVRLARAVSMPEIAVLPDAFHMALDGQSPHDVVDAAEWLAHVHVSASPALPGDGDWTREFAQALRMADYDWRISVESDWKTVDLAEALDRVRGQFGATR